MRGAAGPLGVDLRVYEIATPEQVDGALAAAAKDAVEALVLTSSASIEPRKADILRFATERRWPTIADAFWQGMPVLEYRVHFFSLMRQSATYIDKILWHGAKPGDLPIQLPARFLFIVSVKAAKAIGLTVPKSLLLQATEVIE
jgi:putative ABC transport system substrate-binding protein